MATSGERSWWADVRAVLVALHLVAISVQAFPAPVGGLSPATKEAPSVQQAVGLVSGWTGVPEERVTSVAFEVVEGWLDARRVALSPFEPYYQWAGTRQSWRMMALVNRRPARLVVKVDGEVVYRTGDPTARWLAETIEASRTRGIVIKYSWKMNRKDYRRFVAWLGQRAREDFGEDVAIEACMERVALALPGEETRVLKCGWRESL